MKISWDIVNQELILATREFQTRAKKWNREVFGNNQASKKKNLGQVEGNTKNTILGPLPIPNTP